MSEPLQFQHEAMKTTFTLRLVDVDPVLAKNACLDAFALIDTLEEKLSRYIPGSDIWQINHLRTGDSLYIDESSYSCLKLAMQAYTETQGLFDPTIGTRIEHFKNSHSGKPPEISGQIMIDPDRPQVHCIEAGRELDLGGIGKGFALDCIAERLREWNISSALIAAGASTQLAIGPTPWRIELRGEHATESFELVERALSASGSSIQGAHIVFPGDDERSLYHTRIWVSQESAALADAWSTAAMLIAPDEFQAFETLPPTLIYETAEGFEHQGSDRPI